MGIYCTYPKKNGGRFPTNHRPTRHQGAASASRVSPRRSSGTADARSVATRHDGGDDDEGVLRSFR